MFRNEIHLASGNKKSVILAAKKPKGNHNFLIRHGWFDSKMIAALFSQLFIPIKRDRWLAGCFPIR